MQHLRLVGHEGIQLLFGALMGTDKKDSAAFQEKTRFIDSKDLLGGQKEAWIRHGEAVYRLLVTKQGKLILNK